MLISLKLQGHDDRFESLVWVCGTDSGSSYQPLYAILLIDSPKEFDNFDLLVKLRSHTGVFEYWYETP